MTAPVVTPFKPLIPALPLIIREIYSATGCVASKPVPRAASTVLRRVFSVERERVCKAEISLGKNIKVFPVEGTGLVGVIKELRVKFKVRLLAPAAVPSASVSLNSSVAPPLLSIFTLLTPLSVMVLVLVPVICPRFRARSIVPGVLALRFVLSLFVAVPISCAVRLIA